MERWGADRGKFFSIGVSNHFHRKIRFKASPISGRLFSLFFFAGHVIILFSSQGIY